MRAARTALIRHSKEPSLTDWFYYPRYGCGELWEIIAEKIEKLGGKILVNHTVMQLKRDGDRIVEAFCTTPTGNVNITGDRFISTMPLRDLINCNSNCGFSGIKKPLSYLNNGCHHSTVSPFCLYHAAIFIKAKFGNQV